MTCQSLGSVRLTGSLPGFVPSVPSVNFGTRRVFNERIAELAKDGHRSHAINVLKAQALSLASQIDELRGILVLAKKPPRTTSKSK